MPLRSQSRTGKLSRAGSAKNTAASGLIPPKLSLTALRRAASACQACDLWQRATQTVFGEGSVNAEIMFVGEQPGDAEDITGRPFVGPAGKLLNDALERVGVDRSHVYVTNAVKHFSWVSSGKGKRRIHKKPRYSEIFACRPWLEAEIHLVRPRILVCLGATAAQALLGKEFSVTRQRGRFIPSTFAPYVLATVHPSSVLRARTSEERRLQMDAFVNDLRKMANLLRTQHAAS